MWRRYLLVVLSLGLSIIVISFYLLRKRKIHDKAFVFWVLVGLVICLFSGIPSLLTLLYEILGTELAISSILVTGFMFFLTAIFYLHYKISELHGMVMKLAAEAAVAKHNIRGKIREEKEKENKR